MVIEIVEYLTFKFDRIQSFPCDTPFKEAFLVVKLFKDSTPRLCRKSEMHIFRSVLGKGASTMSKHI